VCDDVREMNLCSSNFLHARLCIVKVLGNEAQKISDEGAGDLLVVLLVHHDIRIEDLSEEADVLRLRLDASVSDPHAFLKALQDALAIFVHRAPE